MVPWFKYCTDLWFTGFDPPRSLVPATAMAPAVTTSDHVDPTIVPQPSATQDPGAKKTAAAWNPIPFPSPLRHEAQPKETNTLPEPKPQVPKETNSVPLIKPQVPPSQPSDIDPGVRHQESSQQGSGSTGPAEKSGDHVGSSEDPNSTGEPNQDVPKDSSLPTQSQVTSLSTITTNSAAQPTPQNETPDPGNSISSHEFFVAESTITLAGHIVVADPSRVHVEGMKVSLNQGPASISGAAALYQGNSILVASQIFHLSTPVDEGATTVAVQKVVPVDNGVSIQGTFVTGTNPVIISGTTVSVDNSHLYFGSKSYPLPTRIPASLTTFANGAVVFPISNAVSIYGTTLTAGAPAATLSGTTVSLDTSNNLIFGGTGQALPSFSRKKSKSGEVTTINNVAVELLPSGISVAGTTLTPGGSAVEASGMPVSFGATALIVGTSSVPVSFVHPQSLITTIGGQVITAAATVVELGTATLTPGAQGITLGGTMVSLGSSGNLVVGSKTIVLGSPSGSLGCMILGGVGSGGPFTNSSAPAGSTPMSTSNRTSFDVHTFEGKARCFRRMIPQELVGLAFAVQITLFLYVYIPINLTL